MISNFLANDYNAWIIVFQSVVNKKSRTTFIKISPRLKSLLSRPTPSCSQIRFEQSGSSKVSQLLGRRYFVFSQFTFSLNGFHLNCAWILSPMHTFPLLEPKKIPKLCKNSKQFCSVKDIRVSTCHVMFLTFLIVLLKVPTVLKVLKSTFITSTCKIAVKRYKFFMLYSFILKAKTYFLTAKFLKA